LSAHAYVLPVLPKEGNKQVKLHCIQLKKTIDSCSCRRSNQTCKEKL